MKIAIAVGCLRSKPAGISGRDYAQHLCDRFQHGQLEWKKRYEIAEAEILHLKQQLVLQQADTLEQITVDNDGTDTDTLFPTPPSSGSNQNILECHQNDSITNSRSKHTVFLHHVISLQTGSKSSSGKGLDSLAKKSIEHSLDILQEHIGDTDISNRLQIQCIQSIENLYACCDCKLKNKILETVKLSADKLVTRIISREEYKSQDQRKHRELLRELSQQREMSIPVIESLVECIQTFSDTLREVAGKRQPLDPYYFCNVYYIFDTLDKCLQSVTQNALSAEFKDKIQSKLEDSLLYLTDKFPLFAHAVWRVTAKLNYSRYC